MRTHRHIVSSDWAAAATAAADKRLKESTLCAVKQAEHTTKQPLFPGSSQSTGDFAY